MKKISWGILSTAKIGRVHVIPALQNGLYSSVDAIASRSLEHARQTATAAGIPKAYGSYEALLADPDIDAIYNPLPNHLHIPWTIKALESGKHVLCEKPISMDYEEAVFFQKELEKYPNLKVMEAFMYRFHPQWIKANTLLHEGTIGRLVTINSLFSYYNDDPKNIRNQEGIGGGALMDIGCYCISISRLLAGKEPNQVMGLVEFDPVLKVDRLASGILDFGDSTATFTCCTQMAPYQVVHIVGTEGRIEIEIPFNAPIDKPCKLFLQKGNEKELLEFDVADQYILQCDAFAKALLDNTEVPTPITDAVANMKVIDAIFESSDARGWVGI